MSRWRCPSCGYSYDEQRGHPREGFPPARRGARCPTSGPVRTAACATRWTSRRTPRRWRGERTHALRGRRPRAAARHALRRGPRRARAARLERSDDGGRGGRRGRQPADAVQGVWLARRVRAGVRAARGRRLHRRGGGRAGRASGGPAGGAHRGVRAVSHGRRRGSADPRRDPRRRGDAAVRHHPRPDPCRGRRRASALGDRHTLAAGGRTRRGAAGGVRGASGDQLRHAARRPGGDDRLLDRRAAWGRSSTARYSCTQLDVSPAAARA